VTWFLLPQSMFMSMTWWFTATSEWTAASWAYSIVPDHFARKSDLWTSFFIFYLYLLSRTSRLVSDFFLFSVGKNLWHPVYLRASLKSCRFILCLVSVTKDQSSSSGSSLRAESDIWAKNEEQKKRLNNPAEGKNNLKFGTWLKIQC